MFPKVGLTAVTLYLPNEGKDLVFPRIMDGENIRSGSGRHTIRCSSLAPLSAESLPTAMVILQARPGELSGDRPSIWLSCQLSHCPQFLGVRGALCLLSLT